MLKANECRLTVGYRLVDNPEFPRQQNNSNANRFVQREVYFHNKRHERGNIKKEIDQKINKKERYRLLLDWATAIRDWFVPYFSKEYSERGVVLT